MVETGQLGKLGKKEEEIVNKISKFVGWFLITIGTIILLIIAWFLIIVGIVGLILPFIPGIVLIILGVYILKSKYVKNLSVRIMRKIKS